MSPPAESGPVLVRSISSSAPTDPGRRLEAPRPTDSLRTRTKAAAALESAHAALSEDRFVVRARAVFFARLAFLSLALAVFCIPSWSAAFGMSGKLAYGVFAGMAAYTVANYLLIPKALGRPFTFITLCADLVVLVAVVSNTGGMHSPFLATQILFTTFFVLLFPNPLAVVPPLLTFPLVARLDEMIAGHASARVDSFILLWYSAINCILVYVMVYLNDNERARQKEQTKLSGAIREMAVVEERNRLAREIHDGLGGVLSSVVIQSEYLLNMIDGSEVRAKLTGSNEARAAILPTIRKELSDLHEAAEESMDELRRSLRMMKENFDLVMALADYCRVASGRLRLEVMFAREGRERQVGPEAALAIFRVLQESLTNVSKHCSRGTVVEVTLTFAPETATLTVQDHGKGFDLPEDPSELGRQGHYGLQNMRQRASKVAGKLKVTSSVGNGTRIELTVHAGEELAL